MKRLLLGMAATIVATAAFAQEETASDVSHGGDIRVRYFNYINPTSVTDAADSNAHVENRTKLNLTFQKSEDLMAFFSLLYSGSFGDTQWNTAPAYPENGVSVNQAYMWWKANETTSITAGRMAVEIADGRVFSYNDFEAIPVTHDGLKVGFDFDFGNLGLYAIKNEELTRVTATPGPSSDPEINTYMLSLDFKNLPEALSTANLHIAQVNEDATVDAGGSSSLQHIGLTVGGEVVGLTYNLTAAFQTGKDKFVAGDIDQSGNMFDVLVGYNMDQARVWVGYHMDSGNDDDATKNTRYNPLFYNAHDNAGRMDIFGWGNLTYIYLGGAYNVSESTEIGVEALMFSRTEDNDFFSAQPYRGGFYGLAGPGYDPGTGALGTNAGEKDLGTEIDVWATHKYDNGANIGARLGYFTPGKFFSDNDGPDESSMQVMLTGGFNF